MSIPTQMARQTANRMSLINEMMADGSIATPMELLKIPTLLVSSMDDSQLSMILTRLKKTRKRNIPFGMNGRVFLPTRKQALDLVKQEMKEREVR
jgi:hypothetical protein